MPYDRRPDRRAGGRPPGRPPGRPDRPDRPPRDRGDFGDRPPSRPGGFADRGPGGFADRGPRDRGGFGPPTGRPPARPGGFVPRSVDDGGMSIRLDPRRLAALKLLAAEAGVRPGELVIHWVEERLDAARGGGAPAGPQAAPEALVKLSARVDELVRRMDAMASTAATTAATPSASADAPAEVPAELAARRPRGRPPKAKGASVTPRGRKVALHDEIVAVISERGPLSAAELATAIVERGRYAPPRSGKPLDAATVNSRVSNPTYRSRFARSGGRIGLAASS